MVGGMYCFATYIPVDMEEYGDETAIAPPARRQLLAPSGLRVGEVKSQPRS